MTEPNRTRGHWIDGAETAAISGQTFPVLDPGDGCVLGHAARGGEPDVQRAVDSAARAFAGQAWRAATAQTRAGWLRRLAGLIRRDREAIARLLALEVGKPLAIAYHEVDSASNACETAAALADQVEGRTLVPAGDALIYTTREPYGVVGHIIPWNYPLDILMRGVVPALATGNTVVVKPAEDTPFVAVEIAALASEAGFPPGVFNVVLGLGAEAGEALAGAAGIQALTFCGSFQTGARVIATAGRNIVPVVSLELGGKSPCLVLPDGDLARAAASCAGGMVYNAGQSCIARSRLIVPEEGLELVRSVFRQAWSGIRLGHSLSGADMGPLINRRQRDRLLAQLRQAEVDGALIELGGSIPSDPALDGGHYLTPALVTRVDRSMAIVQEEVFGPVQCVLTYRDEEEAFAIANDTVYGLAAEVWTGSLDRALRATRRLRAGQVVVNHPGWCGNQVPFGGVGRSGFGRDGGIEGMHAFTWIKTVMMGG